MNNNCLFCKIIQQEIPAKVIYENEFTLAFLDINPASNGHCLIIPKKHFENYSETEELYLTEVAKTKKHVANLLLNSSLKPKGLNYLSNQGSISGQQVFHYHEHVIPKYVSNEGYSFKVNPVKLEDLETVLKLLKE